jgi:hypothetical protein
MDFLQEFTAIKNELEDIHIARDWYDGEEFDDHIEYIIHCEYSHHDKPTIHYNLEYGGNTEFNKLLKKYKLLMEWETPCIVSIYNKKNVKNSVAVFLKGDHKTNYLRDSDDSDSDSESGANMINKYL